MLDKFKTLINEIARFLLFLVIYKIKYSKLSYFICHRSIYAITV